MRAGYLFFQICYTVTVLVPSKLNQLQEEFIDYQLMESNEVPDDVWEAALVKDDSEKEIQYHRMDIIWASLASMNSPYGRPRFPMLGNVAKLVLVLPHSNAEEERLFSLVRKNKTAFRPNLKLDGTLSSILTVKLGNPTLCHKYEPTKSVLDIAKSLQWNTIGLIRNLLHLQALLDFNMCISLLNAISYFGHSFCALSHSF